jgi:hypothetical protein
MNFRHVLRNEQVEVGKPKHAPIDLCGLAGTPLAKHSWHSMALLVTLLIFVIEFDYIV